MRDWFWLDTDIVLEIHDKSLERYGGASGVRDFGLLESALARPLQMDAYGDNVDIVALAAGYTSGIVKNHPFVDGNKRTGFGAGLVFLKMNDWRLTASEAEAEDAVVKLASSELDEEGYRAFLHAHLAPYIQTAG